MKSKLLMKILSMLAASVFIFSFAGCESCGGATVDDGEINAEKPVEGDPIIGGDTDGDPEKEPEKDPNKDPEKEPEKDPNKDPEKEPEKDPVIDNNPVSGAVEITKVSGHLEAAYVTWKIDENAKWYNVYVKASSATAYSSKLDGPLVRKYSSYFRADAVGLKAGEYDFKVIPVDKDGNEAASFASEAKSVAVKAHQRVGYAFVNGNVPGAYNMDGTLKAKAQVVYVTAANAKSVKATVNGAEVTGFQSILDARQKKSEQTPLDIRIVGTVTVNDLDHISSSAEGLQIKGASKASPAENITIEGIGGDAVIKDFGILLRACRNDEIRNLGVLNCMDDGVSIDTDNSHLWVHNLDIFYGVGGSGDKAKGDGALDTKNSTFITHSFNHFWDCGKCNLQGMKTEDPDTYITYHHNWYDHSDSRHPRIRTASVHIFNNYFDGNAKYGVGATSGASAFVENNYFRSTAAMRPMMSSMQGTDILDGEGTFSGEDGGIIKAFGNVYDSPNTKLRVYSPTNTADFDCYQALSRDEKVPDSVRTKQGGTGYNNFDTATDMYEYTVESAEDAKNTVMKYAGRIDGGDLRYEFDNKKDDPNYEIIPELKAAVTNYKPTVVKIGDDVAGGSIGGGSVTPDPDPDPVIPENPVLPVDGSLVSKFENGSPSSSALTVVGKKKDGALTINGIAETLSSGLKMESSTSVTFEIDKTMTLTLYFDVAGKKVKIDGTVYTTAKNGDGDIVITAELAAGAHTIAKGDTGVALYYLVLTPVS